MVAKIRVKIITVYPLHLKLHIQYLFSPSKPEIDLNKGKFSLCLIN
jgi:hypothetical protein